MHSASLHFCIKVLHKKIPVTWALNVKRKRILPRKHRFVAAITRMTDNGAPVYAGCEHYRGEAVFTSTFSTCYFADKALTKVKGVGINDSNYQCKASGEFYRVMKFEKLQ